MTAVEPHVFSIPILT